MVPRSIDARSLKDTPKIREYIRKHHSILSGEASAVRANPKTIKELRESGYKIVKPRGGPARVIVPKNPLDKVRISRGKVQRITRESDFAKHVTVPIRNNDLISYLEGLRDKPLPDDTQLTFKFFGNGSHAVFSDYDSAIDYLLKDNISGSTATILKAVRTGRAKDQAEIYQNLEFITFKKTEGNRRAWTAQNVARRKASKEARKNREKQRRNRMTEEKKKEYNERGKVRAKKSRKRRK